jgi:hypothetical protein
LSCWPDSSSARRQAELSPQLLVVAQQLAGGWAIKVFALLDRALAAFGRTLVALLERKQRVHWYLPVSPALTVRSE